MKGPLIFLVAVALLAFGGGCAKTTSKGDSMETIQEGSTVKINYALAVDGNVIDTNKGKDPYEYQQGSGQMIHGLEKKLAGLKAGDKKKVTIPPEEGYGAHNPAAVQTVSKNSFDKPEELKVGDVVKGNKEGQPFRAFIAKITPDDVTLDLNHPLAGKTLSFSIEVVEVIPP